ncbi:6317_t:CDS:1 [Cetraspora pellucida]|uniref:6317_t:CDS:1 n=1 Tax=Cetraspora pellucida TaxID=1433469 RepID=A0ACA9LDU2_9GLOM|nr:6317_t:CDS:1 [Cetraspora pellucida]
MNIDEQQKNIISTINKQEENITSPNLEIDEESKMEFSWSEEVELHSQILPDENQNLEASTPEGNSFIPRMKTPADPLATMYSSSPSQPANFQNKDKDGFTLVFSKRKPKNRQNVTDLQENSNRLKNSYEFRRSPY